MASRTDARLLKTTKFPPEFSKKVDMQKVNLGVMKKWIASRISEILGSEDDVVIELCFNLIEGPRYPDIKALQIQLTGFLDKDTAPFCKELWKLFLSAQDSPQGVPKELLEAKKLELMQEKLEQGKVEDARKRRDEFDRRDRNGPPPQDRNRRDRPHDRGDNRQGRWNDGGFDNRRGNGRAAQRSQSPDSRPHGPRGPYNGDSYVPRGRDAHQPARGRDRRPPRSPSTSSSRRSGSSSRSRSRSPSPRRRRESPRRRNQTRKRSRSRSRSPRRGGSRSDRGGDRNRSPAAKKARRRDSRSRSRSRGRSSSASTGSSRSRSYSSSRSRSRSLSRSRSRSRSRSHTPSRRGSGSSHASAERQSSSRKSPRPSARRRNSSSASAAPARD